MRGPGSLLLTLLIGTAALGCRRVSDRTLRDTEGRAFAATCDREGNCRLTQSGGPTSRAPSKLTTLGRLQALCPESDKQRIAGECRALTCERDEDCPPGHGLGDGTCVNRLCIDPAREVSAEDSVVLCLAGTGLGRNSPEQVERLALGLNCGSPCKVPRTCRQP